jgi:hypothetical protein
MAFTAQNITDFAPTISYTLTKQFKKRYVGFYLYLTFLETHCIVASPNTHGLVGTIFLTFQIDSRVGFGESTILTTQTNVYNNECISLTYTGNNEKQLAPLFSVIHTMLIDTFMITYDPDTRQRYTHRFLETIHEELCAKALHPDRVGRLIDTYGIEVLDNF